MLRPTMGKFSELGIYWDKNHDPFCFTCYGKLFPKDNPQDLERGFQKYNQLYCNKCDTFIIPYGTNGWHIAGKSVIDIMKKRLK